MSVLNVVKSVVELAVGAGSGVVVGHAIRATTPADLTKFGKVLVGIGSFAIGGVVGEVASRHVNTQIDKVVEVFNKDEVVVVE